MSRRMDHERVNKNTKPKETVWHPNENTLMFGKYQNRTVKWIFENNPRYIKWLCSKSCNDHRSGEAPHLRRLPNII
jgi:hypothetical protein